MHISYFHLQGPATSTGQLQLRQTKWLWVFPLINGVLPSPMKGMPNKEAVILINCWKFRNLTSIVEAAAGTSNWKRDIPQHWGGSCFTLSYTDHVAS